MFEHIIRKAILVKFAPWCGFCHISDILHGMSCLLFTLCLPLVPLWVLCCIIYERRAVFCRNFCVIWSDFLWISGCILHEDLSACNLIVIICLYVNHAELTYLCRYFRVEVTMFNWDLSQCNNCDRLVSFLSLRCQNNETNKSHVTTYISIMCDIITIVGFEWGKV